MSEPVAIATSPEHIPGVIIVGAGIGGLLLGTILERLGYPYRILERATEMRSLGSAMTLSASVLPVFEQLGLLEELKKISFPCYLLDFYTSNRGFYGAINMETRKGYTGYDTYIFSRPELHELLRKQIPEHKISLGKRVLRTEEIGGRVSVHCGDGTTWEGDILVGADGAYSGVRQSLYKRLEEQGISLPKGDSEDFTIANLCMVGVSEPQNPAKYTILKDEFSHFSTTFGSKGVCSVVSVPGKRVCWYLNKQLTAAEAKTQKFRNTEWGPESIDSMIKEFEDVACPWGGTLGEIIHATPRNLISKVFLEEKVFETWFHGRTVLLGDACHKMLPGAGLGAVNAMQDAIVLANCIYNMEDNSLKSITAAFQDYYRQRHSRALNAFQRSSTWSQVFYGLTWKERLLRQVMMNYIPTWVHDRMDVKESAYRPQIAWLPLIPARGSLAMLPQEGKRIEDNENVTAI
ncbi:hypothetical protein BCR41DRAFT_424341 [Lobosporangium transversale]|uniref:FAD-binding domain-containing protein n=1 Tax=Lobosporangium transversale TaxID=64571 RepID=A0A1Y2GIU6_9FUNG|nr:hypothetical protein BCR41DRAFT_424341 [Lobosporangium transversale]ORZ08757.1 hypothetical protein BCR41DRAFT_424341 [Lobosporangium transversale]|eukprot:XP_021878540.1 hypothetical protein BCR41DRAFT_424341 [Lobosporangium transversale]